MAILLYLFSEIAKTCQDDTDPYADQTEYGGERPHSSKAGHNIAGAQIKSAQGVPPDLYQLLEGYGGVGKILLFKKIRCFPWITVFIYFSGD